MFERRHRSFLLQSSGEMSLGANGSGVLAWDVGRQHPDVHKEEGFGILSSGNKLPTIVEDFYAASADDGRAMWSGLF